MLKVGTQCLLERGLLILDKATAELADGGFVTTDEFQNWTCVAAFLSFFDFTATLLINCVLELQEDTLFRLANGAKSNEFTFAV